MIDLLATDFIKSKAVLFPTLLGLFLDLVLAQTISHILILFGLPYFTSIILNYLLNPRAGVKPQAKISEQFRPKPPQKITIKPQ